MLTDAQKRELLSLARNSIVHGIQTAKPLPVEIARFDPALRAVRATFVTLHLMGQLRGCIGMIEATRELVRDVAENAFAAAFRDPRFSPLASTELESTSIDISILSPMRQIEFASEADLVSKLVPGVDGLLIDDGRQRATFLPKVWESIPDRGRFLDDLKRKAGLPVGTDVPGLRAFRYHTESFSEQAG